jgi:hypothetical protein
MTQIAFPGLPFGAPVFGEDGEIELVGVELLGRFVVTADDCDMMDSKEHQIGLA